MHHVIKSRFAPELDMFRRHFFTQNMSKKLPLQKEVTVALLALLNCQSDFQLTFI